MFTVALHIVLLINVFPWKILLKDYTASSASRLEISRVFLRTVELKCMNDRTISNTFMQIKAKPELKEQHKQTYCAKKKLQINTSEGKGNA